MPIYGSEPACLTGTATPPRFQEIHFKSLFPYFCPQGHKIDLSEHCLLSLVGLNHNH